MVREFTASVFARYTKPTGCPVCGSKDFLSDLVTDVFPLKPEVVDGEPVVLPDAWTEKASTRRLSRSRRAPLGPVQEAAEWADRAFGFDLDLIHETIMRCLEEAGRTRGQARGEASDILRFILPR